MATFDINPTATPPCKATSRAWRVALQVGLVVAMLGGSRVDGSAQTAPSTAAPPFILQGRHAITVRIGMQSSGNATVTSGGSESAVDAGATGFAGALSYDYGVGPEWSLGIALDALDAAGTSRVSPGGTQVRAAAVTAMLIGATWYPSALAISRVTRPYASVAVGGYRRHIGGTTATWRGSTVQYTSSTAPGIRLLGGVDLFLGHRLRAGVAGGYHAVARFATQHDLKRNVSGPELSLSLGVLLGAGQK